MNKRHFRSDTGNLPQPDWGESGPALVWRHRGDQGDRWREHQSENQGRGGGPGPEGIRSLRPKQPNQILQDFRRAGQSCPRKKYLLDSLVYKQADIFNLIFSKAENGIIRVLFIALKPLPWAYFVPFGIFRRHYDLKKLISKKYLQKYLKSI